MSSLVACPLLLGCPHQQPGNDLKRNGKGKKAFMKKLLAVALLLTATLAFGKEPPGFKDQNQGSGSKRQPTFVAGDMGKLGPGSAEKAAKDFLKAQKDLLNLAGTEDFDVKSVEKDSLGQTHVKFQQTLKGSVFAPNTSFTPTPKET